MAKRTLKDLYVRGKVIELDDGEGEPFPVWVQKLNPVENAACLKKADAARARVLAALADTESDQYLEAQADVLVADKDVLIQILVAVEQARITQHTEAEIAEEEKWKDNNYLEGLRELWDDEMFDRYISDPEDEEASRIKDELEQFKKEVDLEIEDRIEAFRDGLEVSEIEELRRIAISNNLKIISDVAWMTEYYKMEVFYAARDADDHKKQLFEVRQDIDEIQGETYTQIAAAVRQLATDPIQGKDLAGNPPSSTSSEQSEKEEI